MILIHETQLLGTCVLYALYQNTYQLHIEKKENYQKRSPRNKYTILTSQGVKTLSIPLTKGKNQQMPITDVKISYDENWIKNHLETIRSSYGKSPYFEFYFPEIVNSFSKQYTFLYDLNMELLIAMLTLSKIKINIYETENYISDYSSQPGFLDFREKTYLFMNEVSSLLPTYPQVWQSHTGFIPGLSIIDLLLCKGPETISYLNDVQTIVTSKL